MNAENSGHSIRTRRKRRLEDVSRRNVRVGHASRVPHFRGRDSRIELWLHIAEDNADAADRLLDRIDEKCQLYASHPEMGSLRPDLGTHVRCFAAGNYVVIYRPVADGIVILLVIHGARDIPTVFRRVFRSP